MQGNNVRNNLSNFGTEMTYIFVDDILVSIQYLILMNIMKLSRFKDIDNRIVQLADFFRKAVEKVENAKFSAFILNRYEHKIFPDDILKYLRTVKGFEMRTVTSNLYDNMKGLLHFKQNFAIVYRNDFEKEIALAASSKIGSSIQYISYEEFKRRMATATNKKSIALIGDLEVIEDVLTKYEDKVFIYRPNNLKFYPDDIKTRTLGMDIW